MTALPKFIVIGMFHQFVPERAVSLVIFFVHIGKRAKFHEEFISVIPWKLKRVAFANRRWVIVVLIKSAKETKCIKKEKRTAMMKISG